MGKYRFVGRQLGFTLIELLLVVTLLVIVSAIVFPRLSGTAHAARLSTSADDMATLIRFARAEAVRSGLNVRFNVSLDRRYYWLSRQDPDTSDDGYGPFGDPFLDKRRQLPEGVRVQTLREEKRPLLIPILTFNGGGRSAVYEIDLADTEERLTRIEIGPSMDDVRTVKSPDDVTGLLRG